MKRSTQRFASVLAILLVLFAIAIRVSRSKPSTSVSSSSSFPIDGGGDANKSGTPLPTPIPGKGHPSLVFFVDPEGNGLVARRTEVTPYSDPSLQAKAILDATLAGPSSLPPPLPGETPVAPSLASLPPGVTIRAVFFDGKGTAVVDVAGLREHLGGGSETEVLALWSIVDALAFNFPVDVRRVRVLLDGREAEALGHVSLSAPLSPRRDLVAGDIPSLAIPIAAGQGVVPDASDPDPGADEDEEGVDDDEPSPFDDLPQAP